MTRSLCCSLFGLVVASVVFGLSGDVSAAERRKAPAVRDAPPVALKPPQAEAAMPAPDVAKLRALFEAGNFNELDSLLAAYQEAYRKGAISDEEAARGIHAFARRDPDLRALYDRWVAAKPESYVARVARAHYLMQLGYLARGQAYARKTSAAQFGEMYALFQTALNDLAVAIKLDPKPVLAADILIDIAQALGAREPAANSLDAAIGLDRWTYTTRASYLATLRPEWGGSLEQMAATLEAWKPLLEPRQIARLSRMIEDAKSRAALAPAAALVETKRYADAIKLYDAALAQEPSARGFAMRGYCRAELGQHDKAIEDYNRALEIDPDGECCSGTRSSRARSYLHLKAVDKAMADLLVAANNDDAFATRELAVMYAFGRHGVKRDYVAARQWCERSAKKGDGLSMYCIGSIHHAGLGVPKDPAKAARWFEGAAKRGMPDAQADYAYMLWHGQGVPQDRAQAVAWWRAAAKQGNARAQGQLEGNLSGWDYFTMVTWPEWREKLGI
ncbi:MAG: DUF4034 domain-containing protein [Burkholderiales bacterium]